MSQTAARQTCTCRVENKYVTLAERREAGQPDLMRKAVIVYCPTHAEAPAMAEALRGWLADYASPGDYEQRAVRRAAFAMDARAILARIDGPREATPCDASSGGAR